MRSRDKSSGSRSAANETGPEEEVYADTERVVDWTSLPDDTVVALFFSFELQGQSKSSICLQDMETPRGFALPVDGFRFTSS